MLIPTIINGTGFDDPVGITKKEGTIILGQPTRPQIGYFGGIVGTILGFAGGAFGTCYSIKNTKGPLGRRFMIKGLNRDLDLPADLSEVTHRLAGPLQVIHVDTLRHHDAARDQIHKQTHPRDSYSRTLLSMRLRRAFK